jgi:hypothetical protein
LRVGVDQDYRASVGQLGGNAYMRRDGRFTCPALLAC